MRLVGLLAALACMGCMSTTMIRSYPSGAEVLVDGRPVGYTPAAYVESSTWTSTRHVLTLYREGYAPVTTEIAATRPDYARFVLDSLFCWPCLFALTSYPEVYDFPLTPRLAAALPPASAAGK